MHRYGSVLSRNRARAQNHVQYGQPVRRGFVGGMRRQRDECGAPTESSGDTGGGNGFHHWN